MVPRIDQYCQICFNQTTGRRMIVFEKYSVCYGCWSRYKHLYRLWHIKWAMEPLPLDLIYAIQSIVFESIKSHWIYLHCRKENPNSIRKFCLDAQNYPFLPIPHYIKKDCWRWRFVRYDCKIRIG